MRYEDEIKGKGKQVKGAAEAKLGKLANDPNLEVKGRQERAEGTLQETVGKTRRKVGDAVKEVGKEIAS